MPFRTKAKTKDVDIEVDDAPTNINPYTTLSLSPTATPDEIKSAYRKAALQHHPDKVPASEKETAHTKFQEIAFAYAILSDPRRRSRYDTTGRTEESLDLEDDEFDWSTFFREQFASAVTEDAIRKFADEYKGSEEEERHVLDAYLKHHGDMEKVYEEVMLSDVLEDDERFRGIVEKAISEGRAEGYPKFVNETEKKREARLARARKRRDREEKEAEAAKGELEKSGKEKGKKAEKNGAGMDDLAAMIQQRQKARGNDFFENLEAKYAPKGKKAAKRAAEDEPPEEAFARNTKKGKAVRR